MRTIFICVSGISPAIITETLQAMAQEGVRTDEMHVVTTTIGKADLLQRLRGPNEPFARLCRQEKLAPELLRDDHIHVITGSDGAELSDITSQSDAAALAKSVGELVRHFSADHDTRIYASLAGGRKTMSFWIGCAMMLFGRTQDRLMHVLINEPFELCADFFFKPREPEDVTVTGRDATGKWPQGAKVSTATAEINLEFVPFPHIRSRLADTHWLERNRPLDIGRLIEEINLVEAGPTIEFNDETRSVQFGTGFEVTLSPHQYALYRFCAEIAADRLPRGIAPARSGMLTVEDFIAGNRWAARRLKEILDNIGADRKMKDHLENIADWTAANEALWRNAVAAESNWEDAGHRRESAVRALERAEASLKRVRAAANARTRKTAEQRAEADRLVKDARSRLDAALIEQKRAFYHYNECKEICEALKRQGSNSLVSEVAAIVKDLQQARNRLGKALDKSIQDFDLREQLKLTKGEKPFATGLHPKLRDPRRITFG